jgi:hypothetical protein
MRLEGAELRLEKENEIRGGRIKIRGRRIEIRGSRCEKQRDWREWKQKEAKETEERKYS